MNDQSPDNKHLPDQTSDQPAKQEKKKGKTDPQLTELDGLKKGGVEPTVNPADKARDGKGRVD